MSVANTQKQASICVATQLFLCFTSIPRFGHQIKSVMCQHWGSTQKCVHIVNEMFSLNKYLLKVNIPIYTGKPHRHHLACKVIK